MKVNHRGHTDAERIAWEGVLPVLKPPGMTSHDVVDYMRGLLGIQRVGHAGALDPHAAGVLILCIGRATRVTQFLIDCDKTYRGEMVLGIKTATQDSEGDIIARASTDNITMDDIRTVFQQFEGVIEQVPPMLSAVHYKGRKLYELARRGFVVERKPRKITIKRLEALKLYADEPKRVLFEVECSRGTYIRTLIADIGDKMGCGAYLSFLVRTAVGPFELAHCLTLEEIRHCVDEGTLRDVLLPIDQALAFLPALPLTHAEARRAAHGIVTTVRAMDLMPTLRRKGWVRLYAPTGRFLALGRIIRRGSKWVCKPERVFLP
ncbi:MAG TPA: tRNA pseudouridine(55) synthase TruB [Armatimonadetes bacterium]|nr:tRNA pseudouridine(55) synthase TruB [Armatimonadota bacterium]